MSAKPKFKPKEIIRYATGSSALMRVESVSVDHAGNGRHRYYGEQCYGGSNGAYEADCSPASAADLKTWREERRRYHLTA